MIVVGPRHGEALAASRGSAARLVLAAAAALLVAAPAAAVEPTRAPGPLTGVQPQPAELGGTLPPPRITIAQPPTTHQSVVPGPVQPSPVLMTSPEPGLTQDGTVVRDQTREGTHWRLDTLNGPIHVFRPRGFLAATAGTLIYVHGYYTNADEAWEQHRLLEQFRLGGQNALFIVPEAPISNPDTVKWERPTDLLKEVRRLTRIKIPDGPLVVMGHSGAFRTVVPWLDSMRVDQIILLDGLYQNTDEFRAWMKNHPRARNHRLVLVGGETSDKIESFLTSFRSAVSRNDIPKNDRHFTHLEKQARILYLKSQFGHMELVTDGQAIPILLHLTPFAPIGAS